MESKQMRFEPSIDARLLADRLSEVPAGETVKYADLNLVINRNVQAAARGALMSARRLLERERRILFESIVGVGLKRLTNEEIPKLGEAARRRIFKFSKRAVRKVSAADYEALSPQGKNQYNSALVALGTVAHFSSRDGAKKIESAVKEAQKPIPLAKTLELFVK